MKQTVAFSLKKSTLISPYISEGSGLKQTDNASVDLASVISPYISEGSGLKPSADIAFEARVVDLPLHQ